MRINLNQLRSFFLAARERSITKAARTLFVTQPAVTMQIKSLEADLDLKLFTRYGKGLDLTDAGRVLFGYAERIFEIVEEMEYVLKGHADLSAGSLVIGHHPKFCQAPHAQAAFPDFRNNTRASRSISKWGSSTPNRRRRHGL